MFGIGETELVLILLFAFMVFGPDKLPGMGKTLGRALRQFRNAQEGFTQVVQTEIVDPATEAMSDNPKKPNRKRVEFDEDADIEGGEEGAAAKRTETFAERKKRLEAERKAREAAEKQAAEAVAASDEAADTDAPADATAAEPAKKAEPAEEAPKKPSVADLYSMKRPVAEPEPVAENADAEAASSEPDTQKEA